MRRSQLSSALSVLVASSTALAACSIADPVTPTPPPTTSATPWEPVLSPAPDAGAADIALAAEPRFAGNFTFQLELPGWQRDETADATEFRRSFPGCVATSTRSPLAEARTELDDAGASEDLLAELAADTGLPELEAPRRGIWLSDPVFDLVHTLVSDGAQTSYLAARVFGGIDTELVIRLDCPTREHFRAAYADFRGGGHVLASMTPGARATADTIGPYAVHIPVDSGPIPHAMGVVQLDADGHPARYIVAADDEHSHIARRFGFYALATQSGSPAEGLNTYTGYLTLINSVRRGESPWTLYVGDTVNLSAYTVTSVGSVNGRTTSLPAPDPLPTQH